ncbi:permease [Tyzzerella sp. OttesenSCG-928-J15]|nr:permease [Tyzzerella sp. OttesenSCG-928-J15]
MSQIMVLFIVAAIGYICGSIKIAGLKFGTSAVMLVALVFGHFGFEMPAIVKELGLCLFIGSVGFIAGPVFFSSFKKQAKYYALLGMLIIGTGSLVTAVAIKLFDLPPALGIGMMCGALTSTPGLGAAIEATGSNLASVGYGIAYPFGVVGAVLFVQLIPLIGRYDIEKESQKLNEKYVAIPPKEGKNAKVSMPHLPELLIFSGAMVFGLILANITLPLPGGGVFKLGTAGGPLLAGLIFGHFGKVKALNIEIPKNMLETLREFGLMLFLLSSGMNAGKGFVSVVSQYGVILFIIGAFITTLPMVAGYLAAKNLFKFSLFDALGTVCGGRTSTPALGVLINVAKNDNVAASYASTYPISLICIVLMCQVLALMLGA